MSNREKQGVTESAGWRRQLPPVTLMAFTKDSPTRPRELAKVPKLARELADFMYLPPVQKAVIKAYVLRASSSRWGRYASES